VTAPEPCAVNRDPGPIAADFPRLDIVGTAPGHAPIERGDLLREPAAAATPTSATSCCSSRSTAWSRSEAWS
jgi:hypothetical protein